MNHLTKNLTTMTFCLAMILLSAGWALAGDLEPPTGPAPTMKTVQEIYEKLEGIDAKIEDGVVSIPKTGQTLSYGERDDGALQHLKSSRFTDNGDGTVTDNLTNLVWLQDANCFTFPQYWNDALALANGLASGECGLTDGSEAGDWCLPNVRQLQSLLDYGEFNPALPAGHPFGEYNTDVQQMYWSSTTVQANPNNAWSVFMSNCLVLDKPKTEFGFQCWVWPVRAGQ